MSITAAQALKRYGPPEMERAMVLWDVPTALEVGAIPRRLYCNRDLKGPLSAAFGLLVARNLAHLVLTWDGCFQVRRKRGGISTSLHSWGLAVDLNAAWNRMGRPPTLDQRVVACFEDAGFEWGGRWRRPDGMHFQLAEFPPTDGPR